jgi:hypothetical protein
VELKQKMMESIAYEVFRFKEKEVEDKKEFIEVSPA